MSSRIALLDGINCASLRLPTYHRGPAACEGWRWVAFGNLDHPLPLRVRRRSLAMQKVKDLNETASRAHDHKEDEAIPENRRGNVSDGKDEDTPQGGKRRGPGRWVDPYAGN